MTRVRWLLPGLTILGRLPNERGELPLPLLLDEAGLSELRLAASHQTIASGGRDYSRLALAAFRASRAAACA